MTLKTGLFKLPPPPNQMVPHIKYIAEIMIAIAASEKANIKKQPEV